MHSFVARGSAVLTIALTALAVLAGTVSFTDLLRSRTDLPIDIKVRGVDALFVHKGVEQVRASRGVIRLVPSFLLRIEPHRAA